MTRWEIIEAVDDNAVEFALLAIGVFLAWCTDAGLVAALFPLIALWSQQRRYQAQYYILDNHDA